jgi:hypothetical protein
MLTRNFRVIVLAFFLLVICAGCGGKETGTGSALNNPVSLRSDQSVFQKS